MTKLQVKRIATEAILPARAHADDAGLDLYAFEDVVLEAGQGKLARTGVALAIPQGCVGLVADRSSMAKKGIKTAGGVIDAGYRGELMVVLWNISGEAFRLNRGERVAQLLIVPVQTPAVEEVAELSASTRGSGGFGSTGK